MRAGVLHGPLDLRVEEWPDPRPAAGEVVIEVALNGLCGTDATEYAKGPMMVPLQTRHAGSGHIGPTVLGHEFIGTVVDATADSRSWIGTRVACGAGVSCGTCRWCLGGRTNLCATYYTLGLSTHGGLSELVAAPVSTLVAIPDGCPDTEAALAQPLAVGLHAVDRAGIVDGDDVVVMGAGAIGSFILAGLRGHQGTLTVIDVDPRRLEVARQLGATATVVVDAEDHHGGAARQSRFGTARRHRELRGPRRGVHLDRPDRQGRAGAARRPGQGPPGAGAGRPGAPRGRHRHHGGARLRERPSARTRPALHQSPVRSHRNFEGSAR